MTSFFKGVKYKQVTTGSSAMKAVEALREVGANVVLVLTMVDREEGANDTFAQAGLPFRSIYKASEFLKE
jgi:orotate phosphoribosyltransferase